MKTWTNSLLLWVKGDVGGVAHIRYITVYQFFKPVFATVTIHNRHIDNATRIHDG